MPSPELPKRPAPLSHSGGRSPRRLSYEALEDRRLLASDIAHLYDVVHDFASAQISCPATCDDVVQETVIKVVDRWESVEPLPEASQKAYLAKATHNTFIDHLRATARKAKLVERAFAAGDQVATEDQVKLACRLLQTDVLAFEHNVRPQPVT